MEGNDFILRHICSSSLIQKVRFQQVKALEQSSVYFRLEQKPETWFLWNRKKKIDREIKKLLLQKGCVHVRTYTVQEKTADLTAVQGPETLKRNKTSKTLQKETRYLQSAVRISESWLEGETVVENVAQTKGISTTLEGHNLWLSHLDQKTLISDKNQRQWRSSFKMFIVSRREKGNGKTAAVESGRRRWTAEEHRWMARRVINE